MRSLKVLLGNCEPLLNDYIEALLQDVCQKRGVLKCTRASRVEECDQLTRQRRFDLVMLIPSNLRPESKGTPSRRSPDALSILTGIKHRGATPVIAIVLAHRRAQDEPLFNAAGADVVLGLPFDAECLKSAVSGLLHLSRKTVRPKERQWFYPLLQESTLFLPSQGVA